jgi:RNA polymerase sigma-70 factor (ECF subfamily)
MNTTSPSLLERIRNPAEQEAWALFVRLYTPLIFYWARRVGLAEPDAADLVQEVLAALIQKLPEFTYDRGKSFRGWLRTVTLNKWRDLQRRQAARPAEPVENLADLAVADPAENFWEQEYQEHLVNRALELMKTDFQPTTWKACWEHLVQDRPAAEVARELGISVDSVYAAKSRVLRRLRQQLAGLLD